MTLEISHIDGPAEKIAINDARAYLMAKGWKMIERLGDKAFLFSNPDFNQTVWLPQKETFADYSLRVYELVKSLSNLEERDERDVFKDMSLSGFDVLRIRLVDAVRAGTVSIEATRNLIDEARELFLSSASSCINPRRIYGGKRAKEAEEYIRKVRLGQTEVGSYVFTVLSPVIPELDTTMPLPFSEPIIHTVDPFERKVTVMLQTALDAVNRSAVAAMAEGNINPFEGTSDSGVSTNLCDAIANISKSVGTVDYKITWGPVRPRLMQAENKIIRFNHQLAEVIEEASRHFKAIEPRPAMLIKGYVYHLEKDKLDPAGNILIKGYVDNDLKSIRVSLTDEEYHIAIQAHDGHKAISIEGDLIQRGGFRFLKNPRNFRLDVND